MSYGPSTKSRYPAVKSAAARVANFVNPRRSVTPMPHAGSQARLSTRTHTTNPMKSVGPLRGGSKVR